MTDHEKFKQIKTNELKDSINKMTILLNEIRQEYSKYTHNLKLLSNYDKEVLGSAINELCELIGRTKTDVLRELIRNLKLSEK